MSRALDSDLGPKVCPRPPLPRSTSHIRQNTVAFPFLLCPFVCRMHWGQLERAPGHTSQEREPLPGMFRLLFGVLLCALVLAGEAWGVQGGTAKPRPGRAQGSGIAITEGLAGPFVAMKRMRLEAAQRHLKLIRYVRHHARPMESRRLEGLWLVTHLATTACQDTWGVCHNLWRTPKCRDCTSQTRHFCVSYTDVS